MLNIKSVAEKKTTLIISLTYVILALVIMFYVLCYMLNYNYFPNEHSSAGIKSFEIDGKKENINILFLGFDRKASRLVAPDLFRPDTIMIASINNIEKKVSLVSIPRDSYIRISGSEKYDKINHVYKHGYLSGKSSNPNLDGIELMILTINDFLGASHIDYYVVTDIDGAVYLIDTIGGLYFSQDRKRFFFNHKEMGSEEGDIQTINGKEALDYVRNRSDDEGGEIGRIERQQHLLITAFKKVKQSGLLGDASMLIVPFMQVTETNMKADDILYFIDFASAIDLNEIDLYIFAGYGKNYSIDGNYIWYYLIDKKSYLDIVVNVFNQESEEAESFYIPPPSDGD